MTKNSENPKQKHEDLEVAASMAPKPVATITTESFSEQVEESFGETSEHRLWEQGLAAAVQLARRGREGVWHLPLRAGGSSWGCGLITALGFGLGFGIW